MLLALESRSLEDVWFLKSSQAVQNSMFSSQNSDLRKMQKAAFPSVAGEGGREGGRVELWGEGEGGKGDCKGWWGGNSFTAGSPQGSTFSTGILCWKWERRAVIAFFMLLLKHHHDTQKTVSHRWHHNISEQHLVAPAMTKSSSKLGVMWTLGEVVTTS